MRRTENPKDEQNTGEQMPGVFSDYPHDSKVALDGWNFVIED